MAVTRIVPHFCQTNYPPGYQPYDYINLFLFFRSLSPFFPPYPNSPATEMVAPTFAPLDTDARPNDVGILAMEMYFPRRVSARWTRIADTFLYLLVVYL